MVDFWILDENHNLIRARDALEWGRFFEDFSKRRVALTELPNARISTVFLGLDYNWGQGKPLVFETMVFPGPLPWWKDLLMRWFPRVFYRRWSRLVEKDMARYATWEEAEEGHKRMVEKWSY